MAESEHPAFIITKGMSAWRNKRFVRWWVPEATFTSAVASGLVWSTCSVFVFPNQHPPIGQLPAPPPDPWITAILSEGLYVVLFFLFYIPFLGLAEWKRGVEVGWYVGKQRQFLVCSKRDGSGVCMNEQAGHLHEISEAVSCPRLLRKQDLRETLRLYDSHHAEVGLTEQRASLVVEEGRSRCPAESWSLSALVGRAFSEIATGEVEPVTLPVQWRPDGVVLLLLIVVNGAAVASGFLFLPPPFRGGDLPFGGLPGAGPMFTLFVGYAGLRELGLFPLPLFRGECSAEKTRIFHRFRWKTFKPGRDLAILRFTSNQEADIAFLGADGSHATARVGGKYLNHFIACWASPGPGVGSCAEISRSTKPC